MTGSAVLPIPVFLISCPRYCVKTPKMQIAWSSSSGEDHGTMNVLMDAKIGAWIECAHCGRSDERSVPIRIPEALAYEATKKVRMTCERCQGDATMHLQRVLALH
jgi:hypothetical protein